MNSTYLRDKILNHGFRTTAWVQVATEYISLHSADPTADNLTATELPIGTGGYARAAVTRGDAQWSAPATSGGMRMISNAGTIAFGTASADLNGGDPVTHFGIYDAATGGNLLRFGPLGTPRVILSGDPISVPPGALQLFQE